MCSAFEIKPNECMTELSTAEETPSFGAIGASTQTTASDSSCNPTLEAAVPQSKSTKKVNSTGVNPLGVDCHPGVPCTDDLDCGTSSTCGYCSSSKICVCRDSTVTCNSAYKCSDSNGGSLAYGAGDKLAPSKGYCDGQGDCDCANPIHSCDRYAGGGGTGGTVCVDGYSTCQQNLAVISPYGSPMPTSGWFTSGSSVTASVTSPWAGTTGTRYVCTGWTGAGSVPKSGTGSSVTFTLSQDSSITWNWKTQYLLTVTSPYGSTSGQDYYDVSASAAFSLSPTTVAGGPAPNMRSRNGRALTLADTLVQNHLIP